MSQAIKSAGGRAKFGHEAHTGPASPAEHRAEPSAYPLPFPGLPAASEPPTGEAALQLRLALCMATLEGIAMQCLDCIELTRTDFDDGDGLLTRLLEKQLRAMGVHAEHVLRVAGAGGMQAPWEWLLPERAAEIVRELEGRA